MRSNRSWILAAMTLLIVVAAFLVAPHALYTQSAKAIKKSANFSKDGKKTKVATLHATQGDTITWSDPTSDLYFQFMDETLFGVETQTLTKGKTLTLTVKTEKNGTYEYAIFRMADSSFVVGNSPPKIVIP